MRNFLIPVDVGTMVILLRHKKSGHRRPFMDKTETWIYGSLQPTGR